LNCSYRSSFLTFKDAFKLGEVPRCVFRIGSKTVVGCFGLDSDTKVLIDKLREMLIDHYETENISDLEPQHIAHVISDLLYAHRLLVSPIVMGLDNEQKPYICAMDELGAVTLHRLNIASQSWDPQRQDCTASASHISSRIFPPRSSSE
jgi:20S proteasome alpha/beta subunit